MYHLLLDTHHWRGFRWYLSIYDVCQQYCRHMLISYKRLQQRISRFTASFLYRYYCVAGARVRAAFRRLQPSQFEVLPACGWWFRETTWNLACEKVAASILAESVVSSSPCFYHTTSGYAAIKQCRGKVSWRWHHEFACARASCSAF